MSTGISISSINRIKELAEEKKYAEALEILDTQNLDKSINPQFLRISGEIFRENKRYYDSRKILLKAHQMSPQGNRIIFELIQLHLELGYFTKAQKYYEQYVFYSSPEDIQKDYVEYVMKKALGSDVKELASILIPILEQMPEDKWNFEAVLLYDKMERKDKALEESRYILENFKESIYVQPVIDYIDDKLDVDKYFYIYPKEEQQEDISRFGDLIEQEEKLLEADYLRMYPPEARIMVEAEDKDAVEPKPEKKKKEKKAKRKNRKVKESEPLEAENVQAGIQENNPEGNSSDGDFSSERQPVQDAVHKTGQLVNPEQEKADLQENQDERSLKEKQIKEEREAALEKLLSKKIDTDKIKESAKQVAKAVKDIDTARAKSQVKSVAESVKDNVKKATDVFGEAVGTKQTVDESNQGTGKANTGEDEQILDGIIEGVLEPPKKVVGQVVTNEELDALIPDSLEAMSEKEIADIEARREEEERLELEALEASLAVEEKKKSKGRQNADNMPEVETEQDNVERVSQSDAVSDTYESEKEVHSDEADSYSELKEKFLAEFTKDEEQPLDSLGFISVVHSDIDEVMEEEIPDTAGMLRQMIDNKEYYTGEDSSGFESQASYQEHGFEVEDYDFETFRIGESEQLAEDSSNVGLDGEIQSPVVEVIYAQEQVIDFDEIVPQEKEFIAEDEIPEQDVSEDAVDLYVEQQVSEAAYAEEKEIITDDETAPDEILDADEPVVEEESVIQEKSENVSRREEIRVSILLSDDMVKMLLDLKESR